MIPPACPKCPRCGDGALLAYRCAACGCRPVLITADERALLDLAQPTNDQLLTIREIARRLAGMND